MSKAIEVSSRTIQRKEESKERKGKEKETGHEIFDET
jgi:hypothetical protein